MLVKSNDISTSIQYTTLNLDVGNFLYKHCFVETWSEPVLKHCYCSFEIRVKLKSESTKR